MSNDWESTFRMLISILTCYYKIYLQPFNATRINAANIEDRVKELMKENKTVTGKAGFYEEFEVSFKIDVE